MARVSFKTVRSSRSRMETGVELGWYRIISAGETEMPTEAPGTFRCKTWYPIWLDGIQN
jgi:hypothetical protein